MRHLRFGIFSVAAMGFAAQAASAQRVVGYEVVPLADRLTLIGGLCDHRGGDLRAAS